MLLSVAQISDEYEFDLVALVVTPDAARSLRDYLHNPRRAPLDELPAGANPADTIPIRIVRPLVGCSITFRLTRNGKLPQLDTHTDVDQYMPVTFAWDQPPPNLELWVVVYSDSLHTYFPQACIKDAGSPQELPCIIEIGGAADFGVEFKIMVVQADEGAQRTLSQYIGRIDRAGLVQLPVGTQVLRADTVRRKLQREVTKP